MSKKQEQQEGFESLFESKSETTPDYSSGCVGCVCDGCYSCYEGGGPGCVCDGCYSCYDGD